MADRGVVFRALADVGHVAADPTADHHIAGQTLVGVGGQVGAEARTIQRQALDIIGREARPQLQAGAEVVGLDCVPAQAVDRVQIDQVAIVGRNPRGDRRLGARVAVGVVAIKDARAEIDGPVLGAGLICSYGCDWAKAEPATAAKATESRRERSIGRFPLNAPERGGQAGSECASWAFGSSSANDAVSMRLSSNAIMAPRFSWAGIGSRNSKTTVPG